MLFTSFQYLKFFLFTFGAAWLLSGYPRVRIWFLLGASLFFYATNNGWQTYLLLFTSTVDYAICRGLDRVEYEPSRRRLLALSIASNLGMLCWFKYSNFLGETLSRLAGLLGVEMGWVTLNVVLPLGISFYTFEALSYTIDVYRRKIPAERNWNRLAFLVTFFPHLIAGPIVRAGQFFPQTLRAARLTREELEYSVFRIGRGFVKKVVFADGIAPLANAAFDHPGACGTAHVWLGVYAFAFQIFFDFSGYTDIALGSAKLLGFQLPENFSHPYAATSLTDFWRRWHITLSSWLRDYLYIPLGGNRMKTRWGVYRNLMITMLLGGLWHGAAWTFVFWGGLHGICLSVERALGIGRRSEAKPGRAWAQALRALLVFHLLLFSWIPFRSRSVAQMREVFAALFSSRPGPELLNGEITAAVLILGAWLWQLFSRLVPVDDVMLRHRQPCRALGYSFVVALVLVTVTVHYWGAPRAPKAFIYFRF